MPRYLLECEGEARETYGVEAASEEEAREKFERGEVERAIVTEVSGVEIVSIEEETA